MTRKPAPKVARVVFDENLDVAAFEEAVAQVDPLNSASESFVFDYENVTFVTIDAHVHALLLYNHLAERGRQVLLDWPERSPRSYAERMGLFAALDRRVEVRPLCDRSDVSGLYSNQTLLEITTLPPDDHDAMKRCIEMIHKRAGQLFASRRFTDEFTTVAQEVLTNIEDWSETTMPSIVTIQRYTNRIAICIGDGGVGIGGSLRKRRADIASITDRVLLTRVFREGLSSRTGSTGGGAGLQRCVEIVVRHRARLMIRTNRMWSKLIVKAKRGGGNWNVWQDQRASIPGTVLTFEFLEERLRRS